MKRKYPTNNRMGLKKRLEIQSVRKGECILLDKSPISPDGYVQIKVLGKLVSAPRYLYEMSKGSLGKKRVYLVCKNKNCINIRHMRVSAEGQRPPTRPARAVDEQELVTIQRMRSAGIPVHQIAIAVDRDSSRIYSILKRIRQKKVKV